MSFIEDYGVETMSMTTLNRHIFELNSPVLCKAFIKKLIKANKEQTFILRVHSRYNRLRAEEERNYILDGNMKEFLKSI